MANFFDRLYGLIDGNDPSAQSGRNSHSALVELREVASTEAEKNAVQWEIYCADFHLTEDRVEAMGSIMDHTGTKQDIYPNFTLLDEAAVAYLDARLASSTNPEAKARYAQILWNHPAKKHRKYLKAAVDAYFSWLLPQNHSESIGDFLEAIFNLLHLAVSNNYRKEDATAFLIHLIGLTSDNAHLLKHQLIEFGLDKRLFDNDYLLNLHSDLIQITAYFREKDDLHRANAVAGAGEKIAAKLQMDIKLWLLELGKNHESFAHHRKDDETGMIPMDFLSKAISYFKQAKSVEDITRATLLYQEFREKVTLKTFSVDLSLDQVQILQETEDEISTKVLSLSSPQILFYLAHDQSLIQSSQRLKLAEEAETENSFDRFLRMLSFDRNGNVSEKDEGSSILDSYGMHLGFLTVPLLRRILVDGLKTGKVTVEQWLEYLNLRTWFGMRLERNRQGGQISQYNWISILAPGFHEFFFQLETSVKLGRTFLNLVQPLDSLTLKAEGLIRDIILLSGGTTTTPSKNGDMAEKTLEHLLGEECLKNGFTEDDLHFFRYVLTKEGLNLRNDIAHGFLRFQDYTLDKMLLILLIIIRLSKFSIPNTP